MSTLISVSLIICLIVPVHGPLPTTKLRQLHRPELPVKVRVAPKRTGWASYYDNGPGLYGAVHSFRWGDRKYREKVCLKDHPTRCVVVRIVDFCQCFVGTRHERAIDLSKDAFARLAPTSRGVIRVTLAP
jgi:hypothetical protein